MNFKKGIKVDFICCENEADEELKKIVGQFLAKVTCTPNYHADITSRVSKSCVPFCM